MSDDTAKDVVFADAEQMALEARAVAVRQQIASGSVAPEVALAAPSEWELELGGNYFLLFPGSGQWLYYDAVEEAWAPTGVGLGEARLCVYKGELAYVPAESVEQRVTSQGANFCGDCGTALPAGARFCGFCGAPAH